MVGAGRTGTGTYRGTRGGVSAVSVSARRRTEELGARKSRARPHQVVTMCWASMRMMESGRGRNMDPPEAIRRAGANLLDSWALNIPCWGRHMPLAGLKASLVDRRGGGRGAAWSGGMAECVFCSRQALVRQVGQLRSACELNRNSRSGASISRMAGGDDWRRGW